MSEGITEHISLLEDFNKRTKSAFEGIYVSCAKELNIFAGSLYGGITQESEDAVIDAFIKVWESPTRFESVRGIKSYLYVSIKNSFLKSIEKNKIFERYISDFKEEYFQDYVFESELYAIVDKSIKSLPKRYADIINKFLEGCKPGEIAEELGETIDNVYKIKYKAVKILAKKLSNNQIVLALLISMLSE